MKDTVLLPLALATAMLSAVSATAQKDAVRDYPPDLRQYYRDILPQDFAPGGRLAVPPHLIGTGGGIVEGILIEDVVISNTDPNLKKTNKTSNSEPSIAVNPANRKQVDILAFSGGWGEAAPIWHSSDGGLLWTMEFTIPNPPGLVARGCPCDQTPDYGRGNRLSATFLDLDNDGIDAYTGTTTDPTQISAWHWLVTNGVTEMTNQFGIGAADQPWLLVGHDPADLTRDNVYVAYDDFTGAPDMRVAVSLHSDPPDFTRDKRSGFSVGQVNPGHRLAVDRNTGAVYSLFQRCPTKFPNCNKIDADPKTIHWMLNRSLDGGKTWSLNGSTTGIVVATGQSTQPQPKFGTVNALLGGVNHIAVDPNNSDVYVVFGKRNPASGKNRLAIVRLTDDGKGGLTIGTPYLVTGPVQAALPSVAIAKNSTGTIGVLYMQFDGFDPQTGLPIFTAKLALSDDHGVTWVRHTLERFLSPVKDNGDDRQRVLGDYQQIKALGRTFYGVFPGNGVPFGRPFANIDPIFFRKTVAP